MINYLLLLICSLILVGCSSQKLTTENGATATSDSTHRSGINSINDNATSDWNEYSNQNWSFKYPKNWLAVDCESNDHVTLGPALSDGQKVDCTAKYPHPNFKIWITRQERTQVPEIPYSDIWRSPSQELRVERQDIIIDGKTGVIQQLIGTENAVIDENIYVEHDDYIDSIHYSQKEFEVVMQIIGTFKYETAP